MIKKRERGRTIDGVGVRCMICVDRTGSVCDSNDLQGTCFWTISNTLGGGGGGGFIIHIANSGWYSGWYSRSSVLC